MPSPTENSYSLSFDCDDDFTYIESPYISFASIDLSKDVSCTYYTDTEKFKDGEDSACDDSVVEKIKDGLKTMDDLLYKIGISKEDLTGFAKQCSANYYEKENKKSSNLASEMEKASDGQFTMDILHDLNYVIGTDWIQSKDEEDSKSYGFLDDNGNVIFAFSVSRTENENHTQPEELYAFVSTANDIDEVKENGITYENQNLIINENGLKIVRYNMTANNISGVYIAATILTDDDQYTLSMLGETALKDNLNETFDTLISFAVLNK